MGPNTLLSPSKMAAAISGVDQLPTFLPHHLAGAASYHHDLTLVELGRLGQLGRRIGRLPLHLFMQTLLFQLMHDTCHKKNTPFIKD